MFTSIGALVGLVLGLLFGSARYEEERAVGRSHMGAWLRGRWTATLWLLGGGLVGAAIDALVA